MSTGLQYPFHGAGILTRYGPAGVVALQSSAGHRIECTGTSSTCKRQIRPKAVHWVSSKYEDEPNLERHAESKFNKPNPISRVRKAGAKPRMRNAECVEN